MIFEDEDGFEVFEVSDDKKIQTVESGQWKVIAVNENTKIRPNDKVTVKYTDGKMDYDVKYKKIKKEVETGNCKVISINID
jgi:hypothetical protein